MNLISLIHHIIFIILSLFICLISNILTSSIAIPFTIYADSAIMIPICIGTPPKGVPQQCFQIQLDTSSYDFWIREYNDNPHSSTFDEGYIHRISSTYTPINSSIIHNIKYAHGSIEGNEIQETITFGSISLHNYTLILANVSSLPKEIDGILGLNYYSPSQSPSFLSILQSNAIIENKLFAINPNTNILQIGSFPKEIISNNDKNDYFSYCRVLKTVRNAPNKTWKCLMTSIYPINNKEHNYLQKSIDIEINIGTKNALVSYHLLNQFYYQFLPEEIRTKCLLETTKKSFVIDCNEYIDINLMPDIMIEFDGMTLKVPKEELFIKKGARYIFIFKTHGQYDYWVIGLPILKHFITVYDMDKSVIGFYSDKYVINEYDNKSDDIFKYYHLFYNEQVSLEIVMYSMIILLVIGGLVLNAILKYKFKLTSTATATATATATTSFA